MAKGAVCSERLARPQSPELPADWLIGGLAIRQDALATEPIPVPLAYEDVTTLETVALSALRILWPLMAHGAWRPAHRLFPLVCSRARTSRRGLRRRSYGAWLLTLLHARQSRL